MGERASIVAHARSSAEAMAQSYYQLYKERFAGTLEQGREESRSRTHHGVVR